MFQVNFSATFKKQYLRLGKKIQNQIKSKLKELEKDPYSDRTGMDIKIVEGTKPLKRRLRVGNYRIIYTIVNDKDVKVIEVFPRGRGYR